MSGGDLRRWASLMADAIRRGCAGPAIDSRIARAESLDAAATQKRDSAMAVAARRTRPELRSNQPRSAGRPLTPQRNNASGWLDVAGALTRLAADYKAARDAPGNRSLGSVAPSRGGSPAPGGQLTMQDVIGDAVITKKAMADDELEEMMQQQRRREGDRGEGGGDRGEGPWREGEVIDVNAIPDEGEPPPPPPKKTCNAQGCCWINVPYSQMVYGLPGLGGQEDELQCRCGKAAGDFTLPAADARACEGAEAP